VDALCGSGEKHKFSSFERDALDEVERLMREQRAGRPLRLEDIDPLVWELTVMWREREESHERYSRAQLAELSANFAVLLAALPTKT
jgi:hypothetical protein